MFKHATGHEDLTDRIIRCAIEVHSELGAGLLESIYDECLADELKQAGLPFVRHERVPITYKGRRLAERLIADFIVSGIVLVEVKAVEAVAAVHVAQVITYLKLSGCPIGLLINFNVPSLRQGGIRRQYNPLVHRGDGPDPRRI